MPPLPYRRMPLAPPTIEYLAGLTKKVMPDLEIELIDGNYTAVSPEEIEADLVGISCKTPTVTWGYRFADALRKRGIRVVLGGMHPTALPEEAKTHADAVVVGEAESVWCEVLQDARRNKLNPFYYGERLPLENLPLPLIGHLKGPYKYHSIFTLRGCPYGCESCSLTWFFGQKVRYRPIEEVVKEAELLPEKIGYISDDNIWVGDIHRAIDLFNALKDLKKKWFAFGCLHAMQSPLADKLLKTARESGLFELWVGRETYSDGKKEKNREETIKKIRDYGIEVILPVLLGRRTDTLDDFEKAVELADQLKVTVHPGLLVPYPGTKLYEKYKPFLYKDRGWEYYNGGYAVFEHPTLSPQVREEKFYQVSLKFLSLGRLFKHLFEIPLTGFPTTHLYFLMRQLPVHRAMKTAYQKWQKSKLKI